MGILDFLKRGKKEEDIPDFGPADDLGGPPAFPPGPRAPTAPTATAPPQFPGTEPYPPAPQSYPLPSTPTFPTPASVSPAQPESDTKRELERVNHKLDLISERISKIEQTLDFMQRYVYSNR